MTDTFVEVVARVQCSQGKSMTKNVSNCINISSKSERKMLICIESTFCGSSQVEGRNCM